jgi:hypothetical protein
MPESTELPLCRNPVLGLHRIEHPSYASKYDGYCFACANAGIGELVDRIDALRELLTRCNVSMDTAAQFGVGEILPPAYRDSWAETHLEVRAALSTIEPEKE